MKVGTILSGTWGATMVIPEFFKVTRVMPKTFEVVELGKRMLTPNANGQQGYEVPDESKVGEKRIGKANDYGGYTIYAKYKMKLWVDEWDGKGVWADYMD